MIEKAPALCSPSHRRRPRGDGERTLSGVSPSMEGTSGVADRALLRGRASEAALKSGIPRERGPAGRTCGYLSLVEGYLRRTRLQRPAETGARQEVPGRIGLGKSSHRERSWLREAERPSTRGPWTREHSAGCGSEKGRRCPLTGCAEGDFCEVMRGSDDKQVVLAIRFDCRSQRAVCGPRGHGLKAHDHRRGSSSSMREHNEG